MVGSFFGEPGDVAELPCVLVAVPLPHEKPWRLSAYAGGATPMTATASMQLAQNSLCLIFTLRFRVRGETHPLLRMHDVDGHPVQMKCRASLLTEPKPIVLC